MRSSSSESDSDIMLSWFGIILVICLWFRAVMNTWTHKVWSINLAGAVWVLRTCVYIQNCCSSLLDSSVTDVEIFPLGDFGRWNFVFLTPHTASIFWAWMVVLSLCILSHREGISYMVAHIWTKEHRCQLVRESTCCKVHFLFIICFLPLPTIKMITICKWLNTVWSWKLRWFFFLFLPMDYRTHMDF